MKTRAHDTYRSELDAALARLDALRDHATACEPCAMRAEGRSKRRAALAELGRRTAAGVLGLFLALVATSALLAACVGLLLVINDASAATPPRCADFGCGGFGPNPQNVPSEVVFCVLAFSAFGAAIWGIRRCWRWEGAENT